MLQRLGMVMAIAGLIPACLAMGERNTAHRQAGIARAFLTWVQQEAGTLALALLAAPMQGLRLRATVLMGVLPHSPAP